jgi:hypothetical protein
MERNDDIEPDWQNRGALYAFLCRSHSCSFRALSTSADKSRCFPRLPIRLLGFHSSTVKRHTFQLVWSWHEHEQSFKRNSEITCWKKNDIISQQSPKHHTYEPSLYRVTSASQMAFVFPCECSGKLSSSRILHLTLILQWFENNRHQVWTFRAITFRGKVAPMLNWAQLQYGA